jgi:hypothetical protein
VLMVRNLRVLSTRRLFMRGTPEGVRTLRLTITLVKPKLNV